MKKACFFPVFGIGVLLLSFVSSRAQPWQQKANYQIQVRLDDHSHLLHGKAAIEYSNHSPDTLGKVFLHLWPNAYSSKNTPFAQQKVENGDKSFYFAREAHRGWMDSLSITVNGQKANVEFRDKYHEIAKVTLPDSLAPGSSITIATPFRVKIPKVFSRLGHEGQSYQISQWYPKVAKYDKNGWHPMPYLDQGEYYNDFGRYEVSIDLPANYVVGATGRLQNEAEKQWLQKRDSLTRTGHLDRFSREANEAPPSSEKRKTLHYIQDSVTDFAWFADKTYGVRIDTVGLSGKKRPVTTYSLYKPRNAGNYEKSLQHIAKALKTLSHHVGPYPYSTYTVVNGSLKAGGGMEYPTITVVAGEDPEVTIFHEITHSWFQEILAFNERRYPYLDEGLTTFYQNRHFGDWELQWENPESGADPLDGNIGPLQFFTRYLSMHQNRVARDQPVNLPATKFTSLNYMGMVYGRTSWYWQYLFQYLGQGEFDQAMQAFYKDWQFGHPGPRDLHESFKQSTGDSLNWFFKGLLTQRQKPDYGIEGRVPASDGDYALLLENKEDIPAPVVLVTYKGDSVTGQRWIEGFEGPQKVALPKQDWDRIEINPFPLVPEANYQDNVHYKKGLLKPVSLGFMNGLNDPGKNQLYLSPVPAYNGGDGFMAGALLTNSLFPPQPFEFALMPMYGFKSGRLAGFGELRYNHYYQNNKRWGHLKAGVKGRRFAYEADPELLGYYKVAPFISHEFQAKPFRTSPIHSFRLRSVWVGRQEFGLERIGRDFQKTTETERYYVNELTYRYDNNDPLQPIEGAASLQQHSDFVKLFGSLEGKLPYGNENQGFRWRIFGGYFLHSKNNLSGEYQFRLGNRLAPLSTEYTDARDRQDYMYDQFFIDRGARNGLWSQQVYKNNGNFKVASAIGNNSDWLVSANVMTSLPGETPLRIFADFGTYPDADALFDNVISYDAGPALILWEDVLEVYYPVLFSQEFDSVLDNRGVSEWQKIQFTLNINAENLLDLRHKLDRLGIF